MSAASDLFDDDHGRAFGQVLEGLRQELKSEGAVAELLALLRSEAGSFGTVRSGDPTPALRLLAFDGVITELLGKQASKECLTVDQFRRFHQILGSKPGSEADN